MNKVLLASAALVLSAAATATAQPALTPLQQPAEPVLIGPSDADYKDPGTATLLSIAGTIVPAALVYAGGQMQSPQSGAVIEIGLAGMVFGPSLGHWYAHDYLTGGLAMRGAGSALVMIGAVEAFSCWDEDSSCNRGDAPLLIGAGLFVTGTIYDIATAGRSATSWNNAHVRLVPTMISSNGHSSMGVGLGGTF